MATVLVTGSAGRVGSAIVARLRSDGCEVREFDILTGGDLRDEGAVLEAIGGCDAVVHAGAIRHDTAGTPANIVATNVLGTWHVLLAAERHGVSRVVFFSSVQVFGFSDGEGSPAYRPVDDAHPLRAARPYGLSKRLGEEMCEAWTVRTGITTVVLRPVMVLSDDGLARKTAADADLNAFVHLDDVVDATTLALSASVSGHLRLTLCGPGDFDTSAARAALGWAPARLEWL